MLTPTINIDHNNALILARAISILSHCAQDGLRERTPNEEGAEALAELFSFQDELICYAMSHTTTNA